MHLLPTNQKSVWDPGGVIFFLSKGLNTRTRLVWKFDKGPNARSGWYESLFKKHQISRPGKYGESHTRPTQVSNLLVLCRYPVWVGKNSRFWDSLSEPELKTLDSGSIEICGTGTGARIHYFKEHRLKSDSFEFWIVLRGPNYDQFSNWNWNWNHLKGKKKGTGTGSF